MGPETVTILRLVYIHGFQGDHTSFQSFPTDLHAVLAPRLLPEISLESCLYPTYKSKRPINVATSNFLAWLKTQPPGPVILLAHSMGGLLAAEAATIANSTESKRIIGIVAFDVPFLGMHPHVVISGIASLFAGDADKDTRVYKNEGKRKVGQDEQLETGSMNMPELGKDVKTEHELNDQRMVQFVDQRVVDDWGSVYGQSLDVPGEGVSPYGRPSSAPGSRSPSPSGSQISLDWENFKSKIDSRRSSQTSLSRSHSPSPSLSRHSSDQTQSPVPSSMPANLPVPLPNVASLTDTYVSTLPSSSVLPDIPKPYRNHFQSALSTVSSLLPASYTVPTSSTSRFIRFLNKHSDAPLRAVVRWIVERFEFGSSMFDPQGLVERYRALERWDGVWVNYWTETASERAKAKSDPRHFISLPSSSGLSFVGFNCHSSSSSKSKNSKEKKDPKMSQTVRLSSDTTSNWELVRILGADDEVQAHCGLFIRKFNTEYEALVERVATKVEGWVHQKVLKDSAP